jgi:hypothetical protein
LAIVPAGANLAFLIAGRGKEGAREIAGNTLTRVRKI